jgi:hypothetical protein
MTVLHRLDLYLRHVQPTYPLFRRQPPDGALNMSSRLKMATFAVASRFAKAGACRESPLSPAEYAKRAQQLESTAKSLSIDEIKASVLLCIYNITESGHWQSVADVGRLARMADWYYASHVNRTSTNMATGCDAEEWRSVWWTIYTLDVICSAVAYVVHLLHQRTRLRQSVRRPTLPLQFYRNIWSCRLYPYQSLLIPSRMDLLPRRRFRAHNRFLHWLRSIGRRCRTYSMGYRVVVADCILV